MRSGSLQHDKSRYASAHPEATSGDFVHGRSDQADGGRPEYIGPPSPPPAPSSKAPSLCSMGDSDFLASLKPQQRAAAEHGRVRSSRLKAAIEVTSTVTLRADFSWFRGECKPVVSAKLARNSPVSSRV
jgi:hypothetical protein